MMNDLCLSMHEYLNKASLDLYVFIVTLPLECMNMELIMLNLLITTPYHVFDYKLYVMD